MEDRWTRLAPLTGVVFGGLFLGGIFSAPSTPNSDASGTHVIAFFVAHRSSERAAQILIVFGAAFAVFFFASLRAYLRARSPSDGLAALGFGGSIIFCVGATVLAALTFALTDVPHKLAPAAAQALNVVSNDVFFPFLVGAAVVLIGNGLAIARTGALPRWLGWVAFVLGLLCVTPIGFFPAFLGLVIWSVIVSVLIFTRLRGPALTQPVEPARTPV